MDPWNLVEGGVALALLWLVVTIFTHKQTPEERGEKQRYDTENDHYMSLSAREDTRDY